VARVDRRRFRNEVSVATGAKRSTRANAPELNPGYGLMWWLDTTRPGRFYAAGNLGQYIYVAPDRNTVVVRLGERYGGIDMQAWPTVLRDMADGAPKVV
jgi:CubicO group peptidase (beta-lactamase class C family)